MFDKKEYWKRRKQVNVTRNEDNEIIAAEPAPIRGQIDLIPVPSLVKWTKQDWKDGKCTADMVGTDHVSDIKFMMIAGVPVPANRRKRRQRIIDRAYTKKGYNFGMKMNTKEFNLIHHIAKRRGFTG